MVRDNADWPSFQAALALTLARMPADGCLVIKASGNRFAQFTVMGEVIHAEIVDGAVVEDSYEISWEDAARLVADGWAAPSEDSWPNWYREISWPALYRDFEEMADRAVSALRDVLEVAEASELSVESWVNFGGGDFDTSALE
ncbi:TY-Chap domain-containing protein [Nocardia sp. FBN12]|uniref:TY-Chap domain-containing protein n=1 Tax=Nocardia sp. FBN12 TaxID=3419766 RepID=UPI003D04FDA3